MAATMRDLSRYTNLSIGVISKYFNGKPIRENNRKLIERAIQDLNYKLNSTARSLKTNRTNTVGVIIPRLQNTFNTSIVEKLETFLQQSGYGIILVSSSDDENRQEQCIQFLLDKRVDAIIMIPTGESGKCAEILEHENVPLLIMDQKIESGYCDSVLLNNRNAGYQAMKRLLDSGHKKIAIVTGNDEYYTARERVNGCREAFQKFNTEFDESLVIKTDNTAVDACKKLGDVLDGNDKITAVFSTNYETTLGAVMALNERSKKIPNDISFIGFDSLELSKIVVPRLAMIEQPVEEIAKTVFSLFMERMQNETRSAKNIVIEANYLEGQSIRSLI